VSGRIRGVQPFAADHDQQRPAFAEARLDRVDEVLAGVDGVDVAEDFALAEPPFERFAEAARIAGRVLAPIAEENPRH